MRVVVTRSGGFAGIVRTAEVDDPSATEVAAQIREAAERPADDARRDGFRYEFVVVTASSRETYDLADAQLDAGLTTTLARLLG